MALFGIGRAVPVVVRIEANVQWQIFRDPASEEWIGVCQALNLNAIGETFEDFFDCANEATQLLLTELLEKGELQAFLRRQGWTPSAMPIAAATPIAGAPRTTMLRITSATCS